MAETSFDDIVKSTQAATGDTLTRTLAFNAQCWLIANMFEISKTVEAMQSLKDTPIVETLRGGDDKYPPPGAAAFPPTSKLAEGESNHFAASHYTNLAPVISESGAATAYTSLIKKKNAEKLLDIPSELLSLLVPTVRLYKVEYASKTDPEDTTRLIPDRAAAPVEREIIFDDFTDPKQVDAIFQDRQGRISGTGLKSFQWALKGVNPADVDANITAQLKIHFNDVADIFVDQYRKPLSGKKAGLQGKASFLDLIIYAPQAKKHMGQKLAADEPLYMLYEGVFFEIKAVVGWAVPPHAAGMFPREDGTTLEEFQDSIRNSQTILFLQLTTHKFDFNQDGTATLVVNYRARYDNKTKQDDIFSADTAHEKTVENYNDLVERQREHPDAYKDGEAGKERLDKARDALENSLATRYNTIITDLLARLYTVTAKPGQLGALGGSSTVGSAPKDPRGGATSGELLELLNSAGDDDAGSDAEVALARGSEIGSLGFNRRRADRKKWLKSYFSVGRIKKYVPSHRSRAGTKYPDYIKGLTTRSSQDDKDDEMTFFNVAHIIPEKGVTDAWTRVRDQTAAKNNYPVVKFFFLGDLIDIAAHQSAAGATEWITRHPNGLRAREDVSNGSAGFITTDIEFFNVKRFYELVSKSSEDMDIKPEVFFRKLRYGRLSFLPKDRKKLYLPINIASIPIEFNRFIEWYAQTVAGRRVPHYFLNNFITDVITQLVQPTLSSNCFYGMPPQQTHVGMIDFMVDQESELTGFLFPHIQDKTGGGVGKSKFNIKTQIPQAARVKGVGKSSMASSIQYMKKMKYLPAPCTPNPDAGFTDEWPTGMKTGGPQKYTNFKVITLTTIQPDMLMGDAIEDREQGIYHFQIGADRGLLKKATFTRTDAPYLREGRINRDRTAGAEQLRELYSVTLSLFGTPIIKPGQLIYVSPSPLGFGDPRSINSAARFLGIGGYHMVTSVQSTIDTSGYNTTVKALHQAMPALSEKEDLADLRRRQLADDESNWVMDPLRDTVGVLAPGE